MKPNYCLVTLVTIAQFIVGFFILFYPDKIRVASLGILLDLFHPVFYGGLLMLLSAILALIGIFRHCKYRFLYFIPQYLFLLLTAGSSLYYVIQSRYADGVIRSWQFIFIDQIWVILPAILYLFSIVDFTKGKHAK